jgi:hypothetical protein
MTSNLPDAGKPARRRKAQWLERGCAWRLC